MSGHVITTMQEKNWSVFAGYINIRKKLSDNIYDFDDKFTYLLLLETGYNYSSMLLNRK